ncbi:hypothetical protein L1987_08690 [Smallanthus sonchifolius]|uniref:Uncharacterized protein n=1 Tax=Smallanthus sonchifolius TaxID=185202 RepID=A0ACB9JNB1_9ASTR|nr:hypothetical protein L1987_08690 [Smallanthus sonchifolius]
MFYLTKLEFMHMTDGPNELAEELDLVTKMNLAVKEERYSDAEIRISGEEGVFGLYKGLGACLLDVGPKLTRRFNCLGQLGLWQPFRHCIINMCSTLLQEQNTTNKLQREAEILILRMTLLHIEDPQGYKCQLTRKGLHYNRRQIYEQA